ncbi:MAG: hypothetical protein R3Y07_10260, partial [Eubacteriales bacterium]
MPATQKKPSRSRAKPRETTPVRREMGGVICFLLGVFSIFGYFQIDAIFINFFATLLKGFLGVGFWVCAPALFLTQNPYISRLKACFVGEKDYVLLPYIMSMTL